VTTIPLPAFPAFPAFSAFSFSFFSSTHCLCLLIIVFFLKYITQVIKETQQEIKQEKEEKEMLNDVRIDIALYFSKFNVPESKILYNDLIHDVVVSHNDAINIQNQIDANRKRYDEQLHTKLEIGTKILDILHYSIKGFHLLRVHLLLNIQGNTSRFMYCYSNKALCENTFTNSFQYRKEVLHMHHLNDQQIKYRNKFIKYIYTTYKPLPNEENTSLIYFDMPHN
jgi:hypothetical protein